MTTASGDGVPALPRAGDRWLLWPGVASIAGVAGFFFLVRWPGPLGYLVMLLGLVGIPPTLLGALVGTCVLAAKRRFRAAVSVLATLVLPVVLLVPIGYAMECLHLALTAGFGFGQNGHAAMMRGGAFADYDWSVGIVGSGDTFLIYDRSDDIARAAAGHGSPVIDGSIRRRVPAGLGICSATTTSAISSARLPRRD